MGTLKPELPVWRRNSAPRTRESEGRARVSQPGFVCRARTVWTWQESQTEGSPSLQPEDRQATPVVENKYTNKLQPECDNFKVLERWLL